MLELVSSPTLNINSIWSHKKVKYLHGIHERSTSEYIIYPIHILIILKV